MATDEVHKSKHLRIRKVVSGPVKPPRHITVLRAIPFDPLASGPIPGSLEADFLLEQATDQRAFLTLPDTGTSSEEVPGPRYYQEGKVIPYSVIGPIDLFQKVQTPDVKAKDVKTQESKTKSEETNSKRSMHSSILRANKSLAETPEQRLNEKMRKIEEGKRKDELEELARRKRLPPGLIILEDRQRRCLSGFMEAKKKWDSVANALSSKSGRSATNLVLNQHLQYREKLEDIELMERAIASQAKTGPHAWYLSLRAGKRPEPRGNYVSVGNLFSGIYPQVGSRPQSANVLIRHPGRDSPGRKTFRDNPYYQKRMREEEMRKAAQELQPVAPSALWLQGVSKFPLEQQALETLGVDAFRPDLIRVGDTALLTICEHYDVKYKY